MTGHSLLALEEVGCAVTVENNMDVSQKTKNKTPI